MKRKSKLDYEDIKDILIPYLSILAILLFTAIVMLFSYIADQMTDWGKDDYTGNEIRLR